MEASERHRLAATFDTAADLYDRARPGFAGEAIDWVLPAGARRIVELGAGTGKLTAALVARGLQVVAVDRSPNMLAVLRGHLPDVDARVGPAERVDLPDGWADAVLASSAFHWFDRPDVEIEMHRLLRPDGVAGLFWNGRDPASPVSRAFDVAGRRTEPQNQPGRHADVELDARWFGPTERAEFAHAQTLTVERAVELVASRSYVLDLDDTTRAQVLDRVRAALEHAAPGQDTVRLAYRTIALRAVAR